MDPRALEKAQSRLRTVEKAIRELEEGGDFNKFTDIWFTFLTAFKSTYTTLEQGAKVSPQSRQWFGAKARERRSDPLLQYLYQARNDEEHGLDENATVAPGQVVLETTIPVGGTIDVSKVQFMGNGARLPNGKFAKIVGHLAPRVVLATVRDRDKSTLYAPPTFHLGASVPDASPLGVARLAQTYLDGLVKEAEGLK